MAVTARLFEDEYSPEFGSVVIRDAVPAADGEDEDAPLLSEHAGPLWGSVARAGAGWLQLAASDEYQRVLIEAHDGEPGPESGPWRDVLETPYRSTTGTVGLTSTTSGPAQAGIRIGEPGHFRVRVCRRPADDEGNEWAVRFWAAEVRPPAWPVRDPDRRRGDVADDIYAIASWAPGGRITTSVAGLATMLNCGHDEVRDALDASAHLAVTGRMRLTVRALSDEDIDERTVVRKATVTGRPPRLGFRTGSGPIVLLRGDRVVPFAYSPVGTPSAMIEYDGGIVVVGSGTTVTLGWDGKQTRLGAHVPLDLKLSGDGRTLAAQEWWQGADPFRKLHIFDLITGRTHTMPWPDGRERDIEVVAADGLTVWFRAGQQTLTWTAGDAAPVPAAGPPPAAGWTGPSAPRHPYFYAPDCGRQGVVGDDGSLIVTDGAGERRYPLPRGARTFGSAKPIWESPDHLLLPVQQDPDQGDYLLRVDVTTGGWEIAVNEEIFALIWPWQHRLPDAGPPPLPVPEPVVLSMTSVREAEPPPRPPAGPPPRIGYLLGTDIVMPRDGGPVPIGRTSLPYLDWAAETAAGVLVQGGVLLPTNSRDTRLELVRWDGTVTGLLHDPRGVAISRDGRTLAVHELRGGRRPWSGLHLIDLHDGSRRTIELAGADFELRILGVARDAIWFRTRHEPDQALSAAGPPPVSGWDGPGAPLHRQYPSAGADQRLDVTRDGVWARDRRRPFPPGIPMFQAPPAAWEDPGHILIGVRHDLFRFDLDSGEYATVAAGLPVTMFVQAWPHKAHQAG